MAIQKNLLSESPSNKRNENQIDTVKVKRKGGGTLIASRPVFTQDARYVYLNCEWGVKVFSVATGECVRMLDAQSGDGKTVSVLCLNDGPATVTSSGRLVTWQAKSGTQLMNKKIVGDEVRRVWDAFTVPHTGDDRLVDLCVVGSSGSRSEMQLFFHNPLNGKARRSHPLWEKKFDIRYSSHLISWGGHPSHRFIALINSKSIDVLFFAGKSHLSRKRASSAPDWTTIRCHPTEDAFAVGDALGRIFLVSNVSAESSQKWIFAVFHWHTLPCSEIAFSSTGTSMFSGGGEHVLVKWNVTNPSVRYFLPRLPNEIVHITVAPDNQLMAVCTKDNGVQIVGQNNKLQCVLQQLSWSTVPIQSGALFPAGLTFDPLSKGIFLNGRPGHLQLFSPSSETLVCNIDVTMMNYLTQERDKVIVNLEVTHSAVSSDGIWLATIETRFDKGVSLEIRLKFWQYLFDKKSYTLNTSVEMPHDGRIHSMKFRPGSRHIPADDDRPLNTDYALVTTGDDKKMRLWAPEPLDSVYRQGVIWKCQNCCFYRNKPCGPCSFSEDGSVIAVGFSSSLTLWDSETVELKESLTRLGEDLRFIEFGSGTAGHLVLTVSKNHVSVWNLLELSLSWTLALRVNLVVADPYSPFFSLFTKKKSFQVYCFSASKPVYELDRIHPWESVLAAVYIPKNRTSLDSPPWMQASNLYFIDTSQELNCLESEAESALGSTIQLGRDVEETSLFNTLMATTVVDETQAKLTKNKRDQLGLSYGILGAGAVNQLLTAPAHTLPSMSLLCGSLLQNLVIRKKQKNPDKTDATGRLSDSEMSEVSQRNNQPQDDSANSSGDELSNEETLDATRKTRGKHTTSPSKKQPPAASTSPSAASSKSPKKSPGKPKAQKVTDLEDVFKELLEENVDDEVEDMFVVDE